MGIQCCFLSAIVNGTRVSIRRLRSVVGSTGGNHLDPRIQHSSGGVSMGLITQHKKTEGYRKAETLFLIHHSTGIGSCKDLARCEFSGNLVRSKVRIPMGFRHSGRLSNHL